MTEKLFCIISKETQGIYAVHDIQLNSSWMHNPKPDTYAIVPDNMVTEILATKGFCDIVLNEDGTEVVSFTFLEIPEIPEPTPEPTLEEKYAELEEQLNASDESVVALYEMQLAQDEINIAQDEAITGLYEIMLA